jgi:hypothetical protein
MVYWATFLYAIDPADGQLKKWQGPHIPGLTYADAQKNIIASGMGYLEIYGQLIFDTDLKQNPYHIRNN